MQDLRKWMRFVFFRPSDFGEAVRAGTASRITWEKNMKVAILRMSYYSKGKQLLPIWSECGE